MAVIILSMILFSGCGKEVIEGTKLRTDGVYKSKLKDADGACSYICFYEEGKAASLSDGSMDDAEEAWKTFHDGSILPHYSTSFKTESGVIVKKNVNGVKTTKKAPDATFTIKVNTGITTFEVYAYSKDGIKCDISSQISTTTDKYYEFVPID